MKILVFVVSIFFALNTDILFSKPNEIDLMNHLKNETKNKKKELLSASLIPFPYPIISNIISGQKRYREYKKTKHLLNLFTSACEIIKNNKASLSKRDRHKFSVYQKRIENFLFRVKIDIERSIKQDNLSARAQEQIVLDHRIKRLSVKDVSLLLEKTNTLRPLCFADFNPFNPNCNEEYLRYIFSTVDNEDPTKSILEHELELLEVELKIVNDRDSHKKSIQKKVTRNDKSFTDSVNSNLISYRSNLFSEQSESSIESMISAGETILNLEGQLVVSSTDFENQTAQIANLDELQEDSSINIYSDTSQQSSLTTSSEEWEIKMNILRLELQNPAYHPGSNT